jgi:deoxycytidylate deaminase
MQKYHTKNPHETYFAAAAKEAEKAICLRDKCGAVVVLDDVVIGRGYSGPATAHAEKTHIAPGPQKCERDFLQSPKPKSDRTCCVHAEWRAIINAVKHVAKAAGNSSEETLAGSILYFTRVDADGNILKSGEPYCTVCSRLALDTGISQFALWHESGIRLYDTGEYNELSYQFHKKY